MSTSGVFASRRATGLRPPKGYAQSAYSMGCGPQAGEGSLPGTPVSSSFVFIDIPASFLRFVGAPGSRLQPFPCEERAQLAWAAPGLGERVATRAAPAAFSPRGPGAEHHNKYSLLLGDCQET